MNSRREGKRGRVGKGQNNWNWEATEQRAQMGSWRSWLSQLIDYWVTYHLCLCQDCLQALDTTPPLITSTATQPGRYYHHISWRNWGTENICNLPKVTQLKQMVELTFEPSALNHKLNTEFSAEFKIHLLLNLQPGFTPSELKIRH